MMLIVKQLNKWLKLSQETDTPEQTDQLIKDIELELRQFCQYNSNTYEDPESWEFSYTCTLYRLLDALQVRANNQIAALPMSEQLEQASRLAYEFRYANEVKQIKINDQITQICFRVDKFMNTRKHCYKAFTLKSSWGTWTYTTLEQIREAVFQMPDREEEKLFEKLKTHVVKLEKKDMRALNKKRMNSEF